MVKKIGLPNFMIGYINFFFFNLLRFFFNFEKWHVTNPYNLAPYKSYLVKIINDLKSECTIDVGCGLGEILFRANSKKKIGIDISPNVIRANKFIYFFSNIEWRIGSFDLIQDLNLKKVDLICIINFMHVIPPCKLKKKLLIISKHSKYLLIDVWNDKPEVNKIFIHDFHYLHETMKLINKVTFKDSNKQYLVFKNKIIS